MLQAAPGSEHNNYDVATAEQLRGSITSGGVVNEEVLRVIETVCNFLIITRPRT
jgi:hypothetical protein